MQETAPARRPRPSFADDLDETLAEALRLLARGAADRRSPFHTPTLATIGVDGAPQLRSVVLRGFDVAARVLRIHTDLRSAKWEELQLEPRCQLHVYDVGAQIQLRMSCRARLHAGDAVSAGFWQASPPSCRKIYANEPAPGTALEVPSPSGSDPDAGAVHFAVLLLEMDALEWLWLSHDGHRRARFGWEAGGTRLQWVAP